MVGTPFSYTKVTLFCIAAFLYVYVFNISLVSIDIITLSLPVGVELDEDDISWPSDRNVKFQQIDGFKHVGYDICHIYIYLL